MFFSFCCTDGQFSFLLHLMKSGILSWPPCMQRDGLPACISCLKCWQWAMGHGQWAMAVSHLQHTLIRKKNHRKQILKFYYYFWTWIKTGSTETEYFLGIKEQYLRPSRTVVVINKRPINTLASEDGETHRESIKL